MIFIDKTTQHSQDSKQRLENWKINFRLNGETLEQLYVKEEQTGNVLWSKIRSNIKKRLRQDLSLEQAHICCYCGKRLAIETRIEHFLSKSKKSEFHARVFNYDNLLLSCEGEYFDRIQSLSGRMETLVEFARRNNITTEELKEINPKKTNWNSIEINEKLRFGRDCCDPHKGQIEDKEKREILIINPTKHQNCWEYFKFNQDGGILFNDKIEDEKIKTEVENSIRVLNLDSKKLREKRLEALQFFTDELATKIEYEQDFDIHAYFSTKSNSKYPFCFVIYHFIKSY
jgi:LysM repeat protein